MMAMLSYKAQGNQIYNIVHFLTRETLTRSLLRLYLFLFSNDARMSCFRDVKTKTNSIRDISVETSVTSSKSTPGLSQSLQHNCERNLFLYYSSGLSEVCFWGFSNRISVSLSTKVQLSLVRSSILQEPGERRPIRNWDYNSCRFVKNNLGFLWLTT